MSPAAGAASGLLHRGLVADVGNQSQSLASDLGSQALDRLFSDVTQDYTRALVDKTEKLKKEAEGLDFAPYPGELGKRIYASVSKEAWAAWMKHQTMLVNENRLSLADPRARKYLAEQMERHFFGTGADVASGYVPPQS